MDLIMDLLSTGLFNYTRAWLKKSLAVCLAGLDHKNLLLKKGQLLGPVQKSYFEIC
jgi:hypothetical protein